MLQQKLFARIAHYFVLRADAPGPCGDKRRRLPGDSLNIPRPDVD
jgi:hypothetical protein